MALVGECLQNPDLASPNIIQNPVSRPPGRLLSSKYIYGKASNEPNLTVGGFDNPRSIEQEPGGRNGSNPGRWFSYHTLEWSATKLKPEARATAKPKHDNTTATTAPHLLNAQHHPSHHRTSAIVTALFLSHPPPLNNTSKRPQGKL